VIGKLAGILNQGEAVTHVRPYLSIAFARASVDKEVIKS
jgi:hypothetical protein